MDNLRLRINDMDIDKSKIVSLLPVLLLPIAVFFVVYSIFRSWYRLREFKGPWLASLTEAWLFRATTTGELHMRLYDISKKYGDLARIGPNWLMTSDPEIISYMSAAKYKHRKSSWYEALKVDPYVHSVFSETSITKHDQLRVKMQSGYSIKENRDLGVKIDAEIASLVNLIERKYISTDEDIRAIDLAQAAQYWSLDVITSIALGKPFGYLKEDKDMYDFIKIIQGELPLATLCSSTPMLGSLVFGSGLVTLIGPSPKDETGRGKLMGIAKSVVEDRFGPSKVVQDDMLGTFIRNGLDKRQAESEILTTILAGSDTTATAIRATMLYIMTSPRVYNTLVQEIETAGRNGSISSPITSAESRQMPYLQAVIKEGLRIHPPITGLLTKIVNPGGETIKGRFIPGGTGIGHCGWGIQRHPVFGNDVDVFRPERWIEASDTRRREMERTMELVFGTGRWGCLGKAIVLVELDKIFVELLRRFDFELMYPGSAWKTQNFTLFIQKEMMVRITKRAIQI
ncbi:cytochrome P450 [Hypoxylon sp. NC1633]|nr:cytochrome P450 [Hypoxylon sp. NC1633]